MFTSDQLFLFYCFSIELFLAFTVLWLVQLRTKNSGYIDVLWSSSVGFFLFVFMLSDFNWPTHTKILLVIPVLWSVRLSLFLTRRLWNQPEDRRYAQLRMDWGASFNIKILFIHWLNAFVSWLLVSCTLYLAIQLRDAPPIQSYLISLVALFCVFMESHADNQLKNFKKTAGNKGKVFKQGLWQYTRHPNYFFEWLHWMSYGIGVLWIERGYLCLIPGMIMYFLLRKVTGVPHNDKITNKSTEYKEYVQNTPEFFPRVFGKF